MPSNIHRWTFSIPVYYMAQQFAFTAILTLTMLCPNTIIPFGCFKIPIASASSYR
jgi:riboflavin transporter FmnP